MSFECKPAIAGSNACLTCGCGAHESLEMDRGIAVGFGTATVEKDSECLYREPQNWDDIWTVQKAEDMAKDDPDHDWRIVFWAPLWGGTYQRQGEKHWILIEKNEGFA